MFALLLLAQLSTPVPYPGPAFCDDVWTDKDGKQYTWRPKAGGPLDLGNGEYIGACPPVPVSVKLKPNAPSKVEVIE